MYMSECLLHFSMIINVILSISTSAIKLMATSIYRYIYIDIFSSYKKIEGSAENSRYHPFHSEGSPLLHPVANFHYKGPM